MSELDLANTQALIFSVVLIGLLLCLNQTIETVKKALKWSEKADR